jgi:hypothetical protein
MIIKIPNEESISLTFLLLASKNKDLGLYITKICENGYLDNNLKITEKGKKVLKNVTIEENTDEDISNLAVRYRSCFLNVNGRSIKPGVIGNMKLLCINLKVFKEDNPEYSDDHIIRAIKMYVMSEARTGFTYLQKSHFTVSKQVAGSKQTDSRLLTFCEELFLDMDSDQNIEFGIDV